MDQQNGQFTPGFGKEKFGVNFFPEAKPNPDLLISDLTEGTSVSVFGILRVGKSSLLAETRERLRARGKNVIWIDLNSYDTPSKALAMILHSMQQGNNNRLITRLRNWADNSKIIPAGLKTTVGALVSGVVDSSTENYDRKYYDVLSNQTRRLLQSQGPDNKPIIIFDELTTLIKKTIEEAKDEGTHMVVGRLNSFLGLLRHFRTAEVGISMAVSGSVSFDWLKQEYGVRSDSINDCVRRNIREMDRDGARRLLELCLQAKSLPNWNEQLTEDLLDFLPSFYPGVVPVGI